LRHASINNLRSVFKTATKIEKYGYAPMPGSYLTNIKEKSLKVIALFNGNVWHLNGNDIDRD